LGLKLPFFVGATALAIAFVMTFWLSYELAKRPVEVEEQE
jgi:hypothetical protein